jgi:hypothetical protein
MAGGRRARRVFAARAAAVPAADSSTDVSDAAAQNSLGLSIVFT